MKGGKENGFEKIVPFFPFPKNPLDKMRPDLCACMMRQGHRVPPREEAGAGVVERPYPLQRIRNFPLRGMQGHTGLAPGLGAHKALNALNA